MATGAPYDLLVNSAQPADWPAPAEVGERDDEEGFARFPGLCGGVADDAKRRARHCGSDYATGIRRWPKALAATLFMCLATLFSTVALGALIQKQTDGRIGLSEYLAMNSLAGMAHALLGAQPLLVLRPTGPITSIVQKLSQLADALELNFFGYLAATGLCISGLMVAVAASEASRHIRKLTPFTHEIFACFVCSIYVHDGLWDVTDRFARKSEAAFGESLFDANLALLTLIVALWLNGATKWVKVRPWLLPCGMSWSCVGEARRPNTRTHDREPPPGHRRVCHPSATESGLDPSLLEPRLPPLATGSPPARVASLPGSHLATPDSMTSILHAGCGLRRRHTRVRRVAPAAHCWPASRAALPLPRSRSPRRSPPRSLSLSRSLALAMSDPLARSRSGASHASSSPTTP